MVLLGPQGAGKGTQAEYLTDHFGIPSVSIGSLLRAEIKAGTELGKKIAADVDSGKLVNQDITNAIIAAQLKQPEHADGIILDGYPRDLIQAEALDEIAHVDALVAIDISDIESVNRLSRRLVCSKCGKNYNEVSLPPATAGICDKDGAALTKRKDDEPDAIRDRLQTYHKETEPIIDYYQKQGIVARVNGEQPIVEVHEAIVLELKRSCGIEKARE